jgi:1-deoxy-D-xylulose-5-phosphate synthase
LAVLNRYLARLMSGKSHAAAKRHKNRWCCRARLELAKRFEEHAKAYAVPATMFEEFGFNYIGPDRWT